MKPKLTAEDFCWAANRLGCDVAAIQAVAEVESRQNGFDARGRPVILFERHKFYKYAPEAKRETWYRTYPAICNPDAGGYGREIDQWPKFSFAFKNLDPVAAMLACSWGKFQIMGFNHALVGFSNVHDFVDAMKVSERKQLEAFCEFIEAKNLADELRQHRWEAFALRYNGRTYKKNSYHIKLPAAHAKYKRRPVDCTQFTKPARVPVEPPQTFTFPTDSPPIPTVVNPAETAADRSQPARTLPTLDQIEATADKAGGLFERIGDKLRKFETLSLGSFVMQVWKQTLAAVVLLYGVWLKYWPFLLLAIALFLIAALLFDRAKMRQNSRKLAKFEHEP